MQTRSKTASCASNMVTLNTLLDLGEIYMSVEKRNGTCTVNAFDHTGRGGFLENRVPRMLTDPLACISGGVTNENVVVASWESDKHKSDVSLMDLGHEGVKTIASFDNRVVNVMPCTNNVVFAALNGTSSMIDDRVGRAIKTTRDSGCSIRIALPGDGNAYLRYNDDKAVLEVVNTVKDTILTIDSIEAFRKRPDISRHVVSIDVLMSGRDHMYIALSATNYAKSVIAVLMLDNDFRVRRQWCCNDMQLAHTVVSSVKLFTYLTRDVFLTCMGYYPITYQTVTKEWSMKAALAGDYYMGSGSTVRPDDNREEITAIDRSFDNHDMGIVMFKNMTLNPSDDDAFRIGCMWA